MEPTSSRHRPHASLAHVSLGCVLIWAIALLPLITCGGMIWLSLVPERLTHFFLTIFWLSF
ncbi:MAG: hypothetical protein WBA57_08635 [Elainellaceae cyanobacterium]